MNTPLTSDAAQDDVTILPPDFSLKKAVGEHVDLQQVFSTQNVAKAQSVIEEHTHQFTDWVKADLNSLEGFYEQAAGALEDSTETIKKIAKTAFVIKSQAGTFGFSLATQVAKSLDDFCNRDYHPTASHLTVVRKHIDALQTIFKHSITGDGGAIGTELIGNLQKLVAKYQRIA